MVDNEILENWDEIKRIIESSELDVAKHASGNSSAGVRARHGLRLLVKKSNQLIHEMIAKEKALKENKKGEK